MNRRLREYLRRCNHVTVDENILQDLRREMELAVPEIAESIRQREALAAELRNAAGRTLEPNRDNRNKKD